MSLQNLLNDLRCRFTADPCLQPALPVGDDGGGQTDDAICIGHLSGGIEEDVIGYFQGIGKGRCSCTVLANIHRKDGETLSPVVDEEWLKCLQLALAGGAPVGPEVDDDRFAMSVGGGGPWVPRLPPRAKPGRQPLARGRGITSGRHPN